MQNSQVQSVSGEIVDGYRFAIATMVEGFSIIQVVFDEAGQPVDYILLEVNPAYEKYTGLSGDQVVGKRAATYDPQLNWLEQYVEVISSNQPLQFTGFNQFFGRWVQVKAYPLQKDNELAVVLSDITGRKQQEDDLTMGQEKYSGNTKLDEGFFLCQLLVNEQGEYEDIVILEANDAAATHSGLPVEFFQGCCISKMCSCIEDIWRSRYTEVVRTGQSVRFEEYNGSTDRWYDVYAYSLHKENKYVVLFNDITQQKHAMKALQDSMDKYRTLFNIIDEGFCIIEMVYDAEGRPVDCLVLETNPMFEKHIGVSGADGRRIKELVPDLEDCWFEIYGKVARTGEPARFLRFSEALQRRWFDVGVFKIGGEDSQKLAILLEDVTARKNVDERIHAQNRVLDSINRLFREALECQTEVEVVRVCLMLAEQITGSKCGFIGEVRDDSNDNPILKGLCMAGDEIAKTVLCPETWGHGLLMPVLVHGKSVVVNSMTSTESFCKNVGIIDSILAVPLINQGVTLGIVAVVNRKGGYRNEECAYLKDLCEAIVQVIMRRRAEEALRQSEERYRAIAEELRAADCRKNEFLGILSHELRNPLASIQMGLSVLDRSAPGGTEADNAAKIMRRQTVQLARLIDDLLDNTRISRDKISLQQKREDLNEIVNTAVAEYVGQFLAKGVELEVKLLTESLYVYADAVRLIQVVGNLLHNALKFTASGYSVKVEVYKDCHKNEAVIMVDDDGIGIPPEVLPQLFQPFIQVERTLDRSLGGLGLGLSLIKGLVELHGGAVAAHSEGIGKGAQFTVRIPISMELDPAQEDLTAEPEPYSLRVLVIDDILDVTEVLSALLKHLGHQVAVAHNGLEGLAAAKEFCPDVVLCDIGLPQLDGYGVARLFKEDDCLKDIFLIALTGYARPEDIAKSREAGFDEHLAKPVDLEVLRLTLLRAIKQ